MPGHFIRLNDIPRKIHLPLQLLGLVSLDDAIGTWNGQRPDEFEISIRLSSADEYAVDIQDGVETRMTFPHVIIKKPQSLFTNIRFAPRKCFSMIYRGRDIGLLAEHGILLEQTCWSFQINSVMTGLMAQMDELLGQIYLPGNIDRLDSLACGLIHELAIQQAQSNTAPNSIYRDKIQKIASYLRLHLMEDIDLKHVLAVHGISSRTFFRYWSQSFPVSPKQFIIMLKMQEAARLLNYNYTLTEIAEKLKIADVSRFIETFKKFHGLTPIQYRKKLT